jgi:hypothetical protein
MNDSLEIREKIDRHMRAQGWFFRRIGPVRQTVAVGMTPCTGVDFL